MQITELFNDAKGSKILAAALIGVGLLFVYNLTKSSGETQVVQVGSGYADSDRNADVIISTIQNNMNYQTKEITDYIDSVSEGFKGSFTELGTSFDNLSDRIDKNFQETNGIISDGLAAQDKLLSINFGNILSGIDGVNNAIAGQLSEMEKVKNEILNNPNFSASNITGLVNPDKIGGLQKPVVIPMPEYKPSKAPSASNGLVNSSSSSSGAAGFTNTDIGVRIPTPGSLSLIKPAKG